ncbi:cysteine hydrolase family protein [Alicyclobacillus cellulosilyticus]|uniref:cysteine hydrolase family protein n=1 Tax=Alicyclobacillus cellulosilyticus TaxID=1003997 RepID=UPI001E2C365A|nr:isochorismatase family cysteine hydrolase [Alicyclobacillus cellulosilyticus]
MVSIFRLGHSHRVWRISKDEVDITYPQESIRAVRFRAQPKNLTVDLNRCAVMVIDMQNDFCSPGGWLHSVGVDIERVRRVVPPLQVLLPFARKEGIPVIWVNWGNRPDRLNLSPATLFVYKRDEDEIGIGEALPHNGSKVLEKGSWGADIIEELPRDERDVYVDKFRMSGFWDTPLDSILRNMGVTTLFFCGVNTDQCVMSTLQDACFLGYDCVLLEDCTATTSPDFCWEATLYNVKQCYGFVSTSTALIQATAESETKNRQT